MPSTTPRQFISALYSATFNRAPDKAGLIFWENAYAADPAAATKNIAAGFTSHPAFTELYGSLDNTAFVQAIYVNVLGLPGDAEGITFWTSALDGGLSRADFLAAFVDSALTVDINPTNFPNLTQSELDAAIIRQDYLTNKAEVGLYFADTLGAASNLNPLTDTNDLASLLLDPAYLASLEILVAVSNDDASVLAAEQLIDTAFAQPDPTTYILANAPGATFTLTTGVDTVTASSLAVPDIVNGVVDPTTPANSTYTDGDTVNGNGSTIVDLTVASAGAAAVASLSNIANVNIVAGAAGSVTFSAAQWSGIGAVNLASGVDDLIVSAGALVDGVDLSIASGVAGLIAADYNSGLSVILDAGHGSALSWLEGNVAATVAANELVQFTANKAAGDVTVGNINASVATTGFFGAFASADQGGNIAVGNITIAAEIDASVAVSASNINGGSVTVGNVSMLGGDFEAFGAVNQDGAGDVLVGDVSMSVSTSGRLFLTASNTGAAGQSLGNLTVGNVALTLGQDTLGSVTIVNENTYEADNLSLGALTVGNMDIGLGSGGSMDVLIQQSAFKPVAKALTSFGNVAVGNLGVNLGTNSFLTYDVFVNNALAGDIASVAIGNVSSVVEAGGVFDYEASIIAENVGAVTFGNFDLTANNVGAMSANLLVSATGAGTVGSVTVGDISIKATGAETAFFNLAVDAAGSAGVLNIGTISLDTTADARIELKINPLADSSNGDVNIAGLSFTGTDTGSYNGADTRFNTTGSVSAGDVSLGKLSVGLTINEIANDLPGLDLTNFEGGLFDSYDSVDYSGLTLSWAPGNLDEGNGVIIDLTGGPSFASYKGNTTVIGSRYNDIIHDNAYLGDPATGINKLTGGDGADLFIIDTANTGKTLVTMDQVLDFSNGAGDKLDVGVIPIDLLTYAEGTFASFAEFNDAANAANKSVFVGSVTDQNSLIVAVDSGLLPDGNVDFMVQLVGITDLGQIDTASFV